MRSRITRHWPKIAQSIRIVHPEPLTVPAHQCFRMYDSDRLSDLRPEAKQQREHEAISPYQPGSLWRRTPEDLDLVTENKVLEFEFGARSEATGKLTKQQLEYLDHAIQTNSPHRES